LHSAYFLIILLILAIYIDHVIYIGIQSLTNFCMHHDLNPFTVHHMNRWLAELYLVVRLDLQIVDCNNYECGINHMTANCNYPLDNINQVQDKHRISSI